MKTEEKEKKWNEMVEKQLEKEIRQPWENVRYCVQQPQHNKSIKKGWKCQTFLGGRLKKV